MFAINHGVDVLASDRLAEAQSLLCAVPLWYRSRYRRALHPNSTISMQLSVCQFKVSTTIQIPAVTTGNPLKSAAIPHCMRIPASFSRHMYRWMPVATLVEVAQKHVILVYCILFAGSNSC
jgi:hypothetical protein